MKFWQFDAGRYRRLFSILKRWCGHEILLRLSNVATFLTKRCKKLMDCVITGVTIIQIMLLLTLVATLCNLPWNYVDSRRDIRSAAAARCEWPTIGDAGRPRRMRCSSGVKLDIFCIEFAPRTFSYMKWMALQHLWVFHKISAWFKAIMTGCCPEKFCCFCH